MGHLSRGNDICLWFPGAGDDRVGTRAPFSSGSHPDSDLRPALPTPVNARSEYIADGRRVGVDILQLDDGSLIEMVAWDGQSRYTIVVGGLDRRPDQTGEPVRTDSLMLVSIDPSRKALGVLSIPRDLWVRIPEQEEHDRINRAYFLGEGRATGYGPRLLQQTVSWNLGMRVHNYILVDFQAVIDIVDHLGGVEVTIDYTIDDERFPDMNYGYDPFYLPAGTHILDGWDTLRFARTRHGNNDVRRAERQQMVLYAIRDRVLSLNVLQLIGQAPALLATLGEHVQTGLELEQIVQLALLVKDIAFEDITMQRDGFRLSGRVCHRRVSAAGADTARRAAAAAVDPDLWGRLRSVTKRKTARKLRTLSMIKTHCTV